MYQITRKNRIKEDLQLCHANGDVALTLHVDLNVDEIANRVNKAYETLGNAQNVLQKQPNSPQAMQAYGEAVIAVFTVIFGEDGCRDLVEFYEGNYTEMLLDLFPFINGEIIPKIREASADRKAQLVEAARMAKQSGKPAKRGWRR
jgi:hypothetical protein